MNIPEFQVAYKLAQSFWQDQDGDMGTWQALLYGEDVNEVCQAVERLRNRDYKEFPKGKTIQEELSYIRKYARQTSVEVTPGDSKMAQFMRLSPERRIQQFNETAKTIDSERKAELIAFAKKNDIAPSTLQEQLIEVETEGPFTKRFRQLCNGEVTRGDGIDGWFEEAIKELVKGMSINTREDHVLSVTELARGFLAGSVTAAQMKEKDPETRLAVREEVKRIRALIPEDVLPPLT